MLIGFTIITAIDSVSQNFANAGIFLISTFHKLNLRRRFYLFTRVALSPLPIGGAEPPLAPPCLRHWSYAWYIYSSSLNISHA